MNGTQNLNIDSQNLGQCLKTTASFGQTVYHNICNGQNYTIPMGGMDWLVVIVLAVIGIAFAFVLLGMLLKIVFD